jgi:hypothetical protein
MVFKRKAKSRRSYNFMRKARRTNRSKGSGSMLLMLGGAMAYGALREKASNALAPITAKIPLGNIADEAVLLGASYMLYKKTSGLPKEIGKAGMIIESARIGEALISGGLGSITGNTSTSTGNAYVYG